MSYDYKTEKREVFKEENQMLFIKIREKAHHLLNIAGAVTMDNLATLPDGIGCADSFTMLACVDRLVELGEIKEIYNPGRTQSIVFIKGDKF